MAAEYVYTLLDEKGQGFVALQGKSVECVKNFLKSIGWTGVNSGGVTDGIREANTKLNRNQRIGAVYGRDRSKEKGKQYVRVLYVRTLITK